MAAHACRNLKRSLTAREPFRCPPDFPLPHAFGKEAYGVAVNPPLIPHAVSEFGDSVHLSSPIARAPLVDRVRRIRVDAKSP